MGGAESNCYYLARELAKKHEVHIFCSGEEDSDELIDNMYVHRAKQKFRFKYYLASYPSLTQKMLDHPVDVLHIHGFGFRQHDKSVAIVKKQFPTMKIVCTPHGPFMALKEYGFLASLFKSYYTSKIKEVVKTYDAIIQVNPYQQQWMNSMYGIDPSKVHLIPNGIPKNTFDKISPKTKEAVLAKYNLQNKKIISYMGRIQKYKGLDQIVQALPLNAQNVAIVLIGDDVGDRKRLEELAKESNVLSQIVFTGRVSEEEKLCLLDASDIFVFPSEWEAFGIATLEAMARGNAVVSTKTEGSLYLVPEGKNGLLFDFGNVQALKEKLTFLLANPKTLKLMQSNNVKRAKQFIWEDIAKNLEALYKKL